MPIVDARVKNGILKFTAATAGAVVEDFSCQIRSVQIVPSTGTAGENEEVLCGQTIAGVSGTTDDRLDFTLIADWTNQTGYQAFSWKHRGETVKFEVQFDDDALNKWSGTVVMDATQVGGPVNEKTSVDVSLKIVSIVPPAAFGDGSISALIFGPKKGATVPGDVFPAESGITASDSASAGKLTVAGFIAVPQTAWKASQKITVGGFAFHWTATAWAEGAAS